MATDGIDFSKISFNAPSRWWRKWGGCSEAFLGGSNEVLDLSHAAAEQLANMGKGIVEITWSTPPSTQRAQHRADMAEWWREQSRRG